MNSVVILRNELSIHIPAKDRDENISYHKSAKWGPFQQTNFDNLKNFALGKKKKQVFILRDLSSLLFHAHGSICEGIISGTWHLTMQAELFFIFT